MDNMGIVLTTYVAALGGLGAYVVLVLRRARNAARHVPPEDRPWT
jgi:hypothetical protein